MKIAIIIPARGSSKGIPKKNMRLLGDKPLISYPIDTAINVREEIPENFDIDIAVTSDDELIEEYVKYLYPDILFFKRANILARDETTLDPVIYNATILLEEKTKKQYDLIITLLPTTPLISAKTLKESIYFFNDKIKDYTCLILVNEQKHLFWNYNAHLITPRKNRQFLEPLFEETGGIVITKRNYLMETKERISEEKVCLWTCPQNESIDINNWHDFILAEKLLKRKKIAFHVSGNFSEGLGHVHRCINLAMHLIEHEIIFYINKKDKEAIETIKSYFFNIIEYRDIRNLLDIIEEDKPDLIINDTRGINKDLAYNLLFLELPLISINEESKNLCDLTINPEFEYSGKTQALYGYRYNILREDVRLYPIKQSPPLAIKKILITMGGSDPENVTTKIIEYIIKYPNIRLKDITVIIGHFFKEKTKKQIKKASKKYSFKVIEDTKLMGKYLYESDLVITSNSSTVYDSVSLGTFTIAISKTQEEIAHLFSRISEAVIYLGYHKDLTKKKLEQAITKLNYHPENIEIYNPLVKYAKEIRDGQKTVVEKIKEILDLYENYCNSRNRP